MMFGAMKLKGKAWLFGDIHDVDFEICPVLRLQEQVKVRKRQKISE
jgi:hypothetical protein